MEKTQQEKIVTVMARGQKEWYLPQDFMRPDLGDNFVGYEASARLSELRALHPDVFKAQRQGKYMATMLDRRFAHRLPKELRKLCEGSLF